MKITGTRIIEQKIIKLFKESKDKVNKEKSIKALNIVENVLTAFEMISIYENYNHLENVKKLYFTVNNIFVVGTKKMSDSLFCDQKTLYKVREKYCKVISRIIEK